MKGEKESENLLVSVIMPAYNAALYIDEAVRSVINQTYTNWELIIVDDGSTDTTAKVAKNWLEKDERIQYFYQENGKQGKARNLGISKSSGIYLAFLDADDIWLPEKLTTQIIEIRSKNVDLVFAGSYVFSDDAVADVSRKIGILNGICQGKEAIKLFLKGNRIPILTVLVKKEKILEVGGFSENLNIQNAEDYHLWLKLLLSNTVFYSSNQILAKYRIHENSATSSDKNALKIIPNVFFDLMQNYPNYKEQIRDEIKIKFAAICRQDFFTKKELAVLIKKNTEYLSRSNIKYLYLFFNYLFPTKITKRFMIYVLNS